MENCIFCKIVSGEAPSHRIWEDDKHLAFLSIFPNTEGVSVVITKDHFDSYLFAIPENVMVDLMKAARKVALLLDKKLEDVGRTGLIFEGFGVNHIHAKLFPMHGTAGMTSWNPQSSTIDTYFEKYDGHLSSHDGPRADDQKLAQLAEIIREDC